MFMHRQADGHTCTCIDGKLRDRLFKTCIIMYRDNVRNLNVRECRGIHKRVIILKFPMKMNDLVRSRITYFMFIGYLKRRGGDMEGLHMHRHSGCIIHKHATRMYLKKI